VDVDGCELSDGEQSLRLAFSQPVTSIAALREELASAAKA
jgi:hypothetical protein